MEFLFSSVFALVCLGIGLAQVSGLRAFLPAALLGVCARYSIFSAPDLDDTWFAFLEEPLVWIILLALAGVEIILDKIPAISQAQDLLFIPIRAIAGALVFGAALAGQPVAAIIAGTVAGALLAATVNFTKGALRTPQMASDRRTGAFLSFFEGLAAAIGAVVVLLLPIVGIVSLVFLIYFIYRVRKVRKRKYKGLRMLRD